MKKIVLCTLILVFIMSFTVTATKPKPRNIQGKVSHSATITLEGVSSDVSTVNKTKEISASDGGTFTFSNVSTGQSSDVKLDGEKYKLTITAPNRYTLTQRITLKPVDPAVNFSNFDGSNSDVVFLSDSANAKVNGNDITLNKKMIKVQIKGKIKNLLGQSTKVQLKTGINGGKINNSYSTFSSTDGTFQFNNINVIIGEKFKVILNKNEYQMGLYDKEINRIIEKSKTTYNLGNISITPKTFYKYLGFGYGFYGVLRTENNYLFYGERASDGFVAEVDLNGEMGYTDKYGATSISFFDGIVNDDNTVELISMTDIVKATSSGKKISRTSTFAKDILEVNGNKYYTERDLYSQDYRDKPIIVGNNETYIYLIRNHNSGFLNDCSIQKIKINDFLNGNTYNYEKEVEINYTGDSISDIFRIKQLSNGNIIIVGSEYAENGTRGFISVHNKKLEKIYYENWWGRAIDEVRAICESYEKNKFFIGGQDNSSNRAYIYKYDNTSPNKINVLWKKLLKKHTYGGYGEIYHITRFDGGYLVGGKDAGDSVYGKMNENGNF